MKMNVVLRLSFWLSVIAVIAGFYLGKHTLPLMKYYIHFLKPYQYGFLIYFVSLGFPMSWLNGLECDDLWARVFNRRGIEILGICGGIFLGILSLW